MLLLIDVLNQSFNKYYFNGKRQHKEEKMTEIAFDTLAYAKKMKELGFTDRQVSSKYFLSEGQAEELANIIDNQVSTKSDIALLKRDIKTLEYKLTIRLGSMMMASFVATVSILGFLIRIGH